jgi:Holliday junction DNA helicase RuvA
MIAFLRGRVIDKQPNRVIVDVGGVGYDVGVPLSTYYATGEPGSEVTLRIHTHVREDQIALFGFATPLELALFERLIAVNGIGPRVAIAVLSGIDSQELAASIQRGDVARLTRIPGVGKKTAERIVVEMRDRLPRLAGAPAGDAAASVSAVDLLRDDLVSALVNLGYHRQAIDKVLGKLFNGAAAGGAAGDLRFEDLLRSALRELARV